MIGPFPLKLPILDIHTIGAGGGSIASVSAAGRLTVGPRSAGAEPGPACYGRGGLEPTRDRRASGARAHSGRTARGELPLDVAASRAVIGERVARPLGLVRRGGRRGHRRDHRQCHGARHPHRVRGARPRSAPVRAHPVRRRGAAARLPPRRAARHPGRHRPAAAGRALDMGAPRHRHPGDVRAHRRHHRAPGRRRGPVVARGGLGRSHRAGAGMARRRADPDRSPALRAERRPPLRASELRADLSARRRPAHPRAPRRADRDVSRGAPAALHLRFAARPGRAGQSARHRGWHPAEAGSGDGGRDRLGRCAGRDCRRPPRVLPTAAAPPPCRPISAPASSPA